MSDQRSRQLAYSEQQALMLDEDSRRAKARKMAAVLLHFLGRDSLAGLCVLDVGCSGGIVADELLAHGARPVGVDIDAPGLASAQRRFGERIPFLRADSEQLPIATGSIDVVICNHVYEHVVDPQRLFAEIRRVLAPQGVAYLGLGNRLGIMEPHYRLPFLSWLPRPLAHLYMQRAGRGERYHEAFTTWRGLQRLTRGLSTWDYTFSVLAEPQAFAAGDVVPGWAAKVPPRALQAARPLVPTYIWVATAGPTGPAGRRLAVPPQRVG